MKNEIKIEIQRIHDEVRLMDYSEDNFLDLKNFIDLVIKLIESNNSDGIYDNFLNQVYQTKTKQLKNFERNFKNTEERKDLFKEIKENFIVDLYFLDFDLD